MCRFAPLQKLVIIPEEIDTLRCQIHSYVHRHGHPTTHLSAAEDSRRADVVPKRPQKGSRPLARWDPSEAASRSDQWLDIFFMAT